MTIKARYLTKNIREDLKENMVFLGGPRQVGKTTAARDLIARNYKSSYYNWDKLRDRRAALKGEWPPDSDLIILDEFHKHSKWKTWIKGEYDTCKVPAAEFEWFKKISPKGGRLSVITKQDSEERQSISLVPVPVFLVQLGQK